MASKNRLSVNFTSSTTRNYIKMLSDVNGMSQSYVVEELIKMALFGVKNPFKAIPENNQFSLENVAFINQIELHKRLHLSAVKQLGNEWLSFTPLPMVLRSFPVTSTFLARKAAPLFEAPGTIVDPQWGKDIPNKIREYITEKLSHIIASLGDVPDIIHIFLNRADVKYDINENGDVSASVTPHLYVLPLMHDGVRKYHVDHANIVYKNFKFMLANEWRHRKYARRLLLERASASQSGGYFVGFLHQPENDIAHERKDFFTHKTPSFNGSIQTLCKIHIHTRDIRFKCKTGANTP